MAKANKIETQRRIAKVLEMRLHGKTITEISRFAAEEKWNVGQRQLSRYSEQADELLVQQVAEIGAFMFASA